MKKVKTIFVPASYQQNPIFSGKKFLVNGDQTSRDIQAAIDEMEIDGYDFMHSENFISGDKIHGSYGISFTQGTMLYFRKNENDLS